MHYLMYFRCHHHSYLNYFVCFCNSFSFYRPEVVLLFDEPTAACDAVSCSAVEQAIVNCGAACVLITHDDRQAVRLAHRRIILTATAMTSDTAVAVPISSEGKTVRNPGDMADV